ncbi:MAG: nucleoside transporter-domain-containing protein [Piptocephalis tieghemiana]|nr:MAG: nucleoside transporter-domain-containing protein [Piptocephalis tieghemiana]
MSSDHVPRENYHQLGANIPSAHSALDHASLDDQGYVLSPILDRRDSQETEDNASGIYLLSWLHGLVMLLPWTVLVNCTELFRELLADSMYAQSFPNYVSALFTSSSLLTLTILTQYPMQIQIYSQLVACLVFNVGVMLFFLLLLDIGASASLFYPLILIILLTGTCTAIYQHAAFSMAATLPAWHTRGMMGGQAIAGLGISTFQFLLSLFSQTDASLEGVRGDSHKEQDTSWNESFGNEQPLIPQGSEALEEEEEEEEDPHLSSSLSHLQSIWVHVLVVFLVFTLTLALFPAITSSILPWSSGTMTSQFISAHFFLFNLGDLVGRSLLSWSWFERMTRGRLDLLWLSLSRLLFIPYFLLCHGSQPWAFTPRLSSPAFFLGVLLLALTNGWLAGRAMMDAPRQLEKTDLAGRAKAGGWMVWAMSVGLAAGGILSFPTRALACNCNPFSS